MIRTFIRSVLIVLLILFQQLTTAQEMDISTFNKISSNESFETNCKGRKKIKRVNKNIVSLSFFQDFSDSIVIYVDHKEVARKYLEHDSTLVSTDYTGYSFSYEYVEKKTAVTIVYLNEKVYSEFKLNKNFPLYSLHFYRTRFYTVSARKCLMVLK